MSTGVDSIVTWKWISLYCPGILTSLLICRRPKWECFCEATICRLMPATTTLLPQNLIADSRWCANGLSYWYRSYFIIMVQIRTHLECKIETQTHTWTDGATLCSLCCPWIGFFHCERTPLLRTAKSIKWVWQTARISVKGNRWTDDVQCGPP